MGLVATLVDLGTLHLMVHHLGIDPVVANVPSLLMGLTVQFMGNKLFAFRDRSTALLKQGALFGVIEVGALILNAGAFHLAITFSSLNPLIVRTFASALVYFAYSYPLWHLIFQSSADAPCSNVATLASPHRLFSKES